MKRSPLTNASSAAIACLVVFAALPARADSASEAKAAELFTDGVRLLEKGSYADACAKLGESQKLSPAGGTVLNLGYCNEKLGRTATAYALYRDALARATAQGKSDRADRARQKMTELEPRLTRVRVTAPPEVLSLAGLRVDVDGTVLADVAQPEPVDPGDRVVTLAANGRRPIKKTVTAAGEGRTISVAFEMPESDGAAPSPVAPPEASPSSPTPAAPAGPEAPPPAGPSSGRRTAGLVTMGAGVLALGFGAVAGVVASGEHSKSDDLCAGGCTQDGVLAEDRARTWATVSTVGFAVGAVAVGAGFYLFLTSPSRAPAPAAVLRGPVLVF